MPFSISTLRCVGLPSSSTLSEPRRLPMVPSSITVHSGLATCWPMRPLNAETLLAIEIGFQAVADGFVQQDAGPAGTEHHGHFAGRRFHGVQLHDGLARGFAREMLGRLFVRGRSRARRVRRRREWPRCGAPPFSPRQRRDAHARHRLAVEAEHAVAGGDQHVAQAVGVGRLHLEDARIVGAGGAVGALHQFDALGEGRFRVGAVSIG